MPDATRPPLPPPFPVGARVRYVGTRLCYVVAPNGEQVPIIAPGMAVTVAKTKAGYRGTGRPIATDWDYDEPGLVDSTQDGYSVYNVDVPGREPYGRIIWPADVAEWEPVTGSNDNA